MRSNLSWLLLVLFLVATWHYAERVGPAQVAARPQASEDGLLLDVPQDKAVQVLDSNKTDALIKVDMRQYRRLRLTAHFTGPSQRWSLDVGDSSTNDGYGGDAGNRFYDAEVEIRDGVLDAYGSDLLGDAPRRMKTWSKAVTQGDTITLEIANEELSFNGPSGPKYLHDKALFALAGQSDPDNGGQVDYDVYVGVNRVISGRADRKGSGVGRLKVELIQ